MAAGSQIPGLFPGIPGLDRQTPIATTWLEHVPGSYAADPHTDEQLDQIVCLPDGEPLLPMMRVRDVLPTRRWAVRKNGHLMRQHEFEEGLELYYVEHFRKEARIDGKEDLDVHGDPKREPRPRVELYVLFELDPMSDRTRVRMRKTRNEPASKDRPEHAGQLYSHTKDEWRDQMDVLEEAYDNPRFREKMTKSEIQAVQEHRGIKSDDELNAIDVLNEKLKKGRITMDEFMAEAEKLRIPTVDPALETTEVSVETTATDPLQALCGKKLRTPKGVVLHQKQCDSCKALAPGG